jgi:ABC-type nitrate/sulfonate/bicarbonate transport system ATPase subunit
MAEALTLTAVSKTFQTQQGSLPVLDTVNLSIQPGEFLAILGPSGCGKSTLLRLIAGLDQPSTGHVQLGDQDVTEVDPRCAVVFQEPRLFPWKTIAQNVAIGARRSTNAHSPHELLKTVGLADFGDAYPHQLSGGMAQRAALARALVGKPEVLLLDEPFAALDALTRMQMQDLLAEVCRTLRTTVVMVTHDVDEALYLADRIIIMSPRPTSIQTTLKVSLQRPRDRGDAEIVEPRARILAHFGLSHAIASDGPDTYTI